MRNRNLKNDINKVIAETVITEAQAEEIKEKSFYFIVRQDFGSYKKGERITGYDEIEEIENKKSMNLVMKVNK
jgi:hypothetical protein